MGLLKLLWNAVTLTFWNMMLQYFWASATDSPGRLVTDSVEWKEGIEGRQTQRDLEALGVGRELCKLFKLQLASSVHLPAQ